MHEITRMRFLLAAALLAGSVILPHGVLAADPTKPNIVLCMTDDQG